MLTRFFLFTITLASINEAPMAIARPENTFLRTVHSVVLGRDSSRFVAAMAEAERFEAAGRTADARRAYRKLISDELDAGEYPTEAMWRLANAYFADDNELGAARELDRLADAASSFGDPATELRARFESAVLYSRHHEPARVAAQLERVRALLKSPAIDEHTRQSISARIAK
jgi:hypothetical protein